jgi:hypothetical protein
LISSFSPTGSWNFLGFREKFDHWESGGPLFLAKTHWETFYFAVCLHTVG